MTQFNRKIEYNPKEGIVNQKDGTPNRISHQGFWRRFVYFLVKQIRISNIFFILLGVMEISLLENSLMRSFDKLAILAVLFVSNFLLFFIRYLKLRLHDNNINQLFMDFQLLDYSDPNIVQPIPGVKRLKHLKEGDILYFSPQQSDRKEVYIPADVVLLGVQCVCHYHNSQEKRTCGQCMISTKNVTGDLDMKMRQAPKDLSYRNKPKDLNYSGTLKYGEPTPSLFEFSGTFMMKGKQNAINLNHVNFVPRGCLLSNAHSVVCMVVYVGEETKIGQMASYEKIMMRRSSSDKSIDNSLLTLIYCAICVSVILCFHEVNIPSHVDFLSHVISNNTTVQNEELIGIFLSVGNMIPISLLFTIEVVRIFLALQISNDSTICPPGRNTLSSSSIVDDLGKVSHIVLDGSGIFTERNKSVKSLSTPSGIYSALEEDREKVENDLDSGLDKADNLKLLLTGILVCNHATRKKEDITQGNIEEKALLAMAERFGYRLIKKDNNELEMSMNGRLQSFDIIDSTQLELNSNLRLYTILKSKENESYHVFTLGEKGHFKNFPKYNIIANFEKRGMETMYFGCGTFNEKESAFLSQFQNDPETKRMTVAEKADKVLESVFPHSYRVIGSIGLKKNIAPTVHNVLPRIKMAGIKVFLVSKDPMDIAKTYAQDINLSSLDKIVDLDRNTFMRANLKNCRAEGCFVRDILSTGYISDLKRFHEIMQSADSIVFSDMTSDDKRGVVRVLKGNFPLSWGEKVKKCLGALFPSKYNKKSILALGNSLHDIPMMNMADISVLYDDDEGTQKEVNLNSVDFSVSSLEGFTNLVLVRGVMNSIIISKVAFYLLYKTILKESMVFVYWAFATHSVEGRLYVTSENLLFSCYSGLVPIVLGILDQTYSSEEILRNPGIYKEKYNKINSLVSLGLWVLCALFHGAILFFLSFMTFYIQKGWISESGQVVDGSVFGTFILTIIVIGVHIKIICIESLMVPREADLPPRFGHTSPKTLIVLSAVAIISVSFYFFVNSTRLLKHFLETSDLSMTLFSLPQFWASIPVILVTCFMVDYSYKVMRVILRQPKEKKLPLLPRVVNLANLARRQKESFV